MICNSFESTKGANVTIGPHTLRHYRLSNGINLLVQENHVSPSVVLRGHLWAGAVNDSPDKPGLASFSASSLIRGTSNRSFQQINEITESVGADVFFGAGRHLVGFGGKALSEDFDLLINVLADILQHPTFPPGEVEKVQGQILTGLKELENNTRGLAGREFRQLLYTPQHPYGRPISGTLDSVPQISRQDLVEFYHENYHPDDATLVVVGDVEAAQVYDLLEHALGTWQPKPAAVLPALPTAMPLDERRSKVRTLTNKTQVDLVLGYVGPARSALDFYAAQVANVILGQLGLMGRLGESVRDRQGLAYYAYSSIEARLGPGPWSIRAGISPNHVSRAVDSILEEIVRLREEPVSDQELEDSQDYLTGGLPLRLETNEGVASLLLNIQLFDLGDDYIERYPSIIRAITKEQVQSAARKYLDPQHYALAIVGPYEEE